MRKKLKAPLPLKALIPAALQFRQVDDKTRLQDLRQKWPELVGPLLDRKSLPLKIYGKRLIVGVAGSVWASELEFSKKSLLDKIQKAIPHLPLEEIRFQVTTL